MKKALLLEDNRLCRMVLKDIVEQYGFETECHTDPVSFLNSCDRNLSLSQYIEIYNMILTDKDMPGMSGLQFLDLIIREVPGIKDMSIAVMSGDWSFQEVTHVQRLGFRHFDKPELDGLYDWLQRNAETTVNRDSITLTSKYVCYK